MARFVFGDRSASSSVLVSAVSASLQVPRRQSCALPSENARSLIIQCAHDLESRTPETTSDPRWRGGCSPRWQGPDGKRASPDGLRGAEPCTRSSGRAVAAGMDYADFARSSAHYAAEQRRGPRPRPMWRVTSASGIEAQQVERPFVKRMGAGSNPAGPADWRSTPHSLRECCAPRQSRGLRFT